MTGDTDTSEGTAVETGSERSGARLVPQDRPYAERRDTLWIITLGPTVWALHFGFCYAFAAIVCARRDAPLDAPAGDLRTGIAFATVVALLAVVVLGWRAWRRWDYLDDFDYVHDLDTSEHRHEFLGHASFLLTVVSFVGIAFTALSAWFIETCL